MPPPNRSDKVKSTDALVSTSASLKNELETLRRTHLEESAALRMDLLETVCERTPRKE